MLLVSTTRIIPGRAVPSFLSGRYPAVKVRKKLYVTSVTNPYDSTIQSIHIEISINANVKLLMDDKMQWVYHLD